MKPYIKIFILLPFILLSAPISGMNTYIPPLIKRQLITHEEPVSLIKIAQSRALLTDAQRLKYIKDALHSSDITLVDLKATLTYYKERFETFTKLLQDRRKSKRLNCTMRGGHMFSPFTAIMQEDKRLVLFNAQLVKRYHDTMKILGYIHPRHNSWQYSKYLRFPIPVAQMIAYYSALDTCKKQWAR